MKKNKSRNVMRDANVQRKVFQIKHLKRKNGIEVAFTSSTEGKTKVFVFYCHVGKKK